MKSLIYSFRHIGLLTIALTVALAANFAYGQWTNPTQAPPGGQVAVPVHTATSTQVKTGNFGAVDILAAGVSEAGDHMRSPVYCDDRGYGLDGNPFTADDDCFTSSQVGGGGGGAGTSIFPGWPNTIACGGYAWHIYEPGKYNYLGEAQSTARTNHIWFNELSGDWDTWQGRGAAGNPGGCVGQTIQQICASGQCAGYSGSLPFAGQVCNSYGCSPFGACAPGGNCPSSATDTCNIYGCSEFGPCAAGGCPMSVGETCNAYGCS